MTKQQYLTPKNYKRLDKMFKFISLYYQLDIFPKVKLKFCQIKLKNVFGYFSDVQKLENYLRKSNWNRYLNK